MILTLFELLLSILTNHFDVDIHSYFVAPDLHRAYDVHSHLERKSIIYKGSISIPYFTLMYIINRYLIIVMSRYNLMRFQLMPLQGLLVHHLILSHLYELQEH